MVDLPTNLNIFPQTFNGNLAPFSERIRPGFHGWFTTDLDIVRLTFNDHFVLDSMAISSTISYTILRPYRTWFRDHFSKRYGAILLNISSNKTCIFSRQSSISLQESNILLEKSIISSNPIYQEFQSNFATIWCLFT